MNKLSVTLLLGLGFVAFIAVLLVVGLAPVEAGSAKSGESSVHASFTKTPILDYQGIKAKPPKVNLHSAIVVNYDNGKVLYAKNADLVHPIASISKLVAAMVVLDKKIDLSSTITITIYNDCAVDIYYAYISGSDDSSWGSDELPSTIPVGNSYTWVYNPGEYDIKVEAFNHGYLDSWYNLVMNTNQYLVACP